MFSTPNFTVNSEVVVSCSEWDSLVLLLLTFGERLRALLSTDTECVCAMTWAFGDMALANGDWTYKAFTFRERQTANSSALCHVMTGSAKKSKMRSGARGQQILEGIRTKNISHVDCILQKCQRLGGVPQ